MNTEKLAEAIFAYFTDAEGPLSRCLATHGQCIDRLTCEPDSIIEDIERVIKEEMKGAGHVD